MEKERLFKAFQTIIKLLYLLNDGNKIERFINKKDNICRYDERKS